MNDSTARLVLSLFLAFACAASSQEPPPLTRCADVRKLARADAARALPVMVRGVVTFTDPVASGGLVVQDESGVWAALGEAARLSSPANPLPPVKIGDVVEITGKTGPGHYAPVIEARTVRVVAHAPLPEPRRVMLPELESGRLDCQRVALDGVVQSARPGNYGAAPTLQLNIATFGGHFSFTLLGTPKLDEADLVDAEVSVAGICQPLFNTRAELIGVRVTTNSPGDLHMLRPPASDPYSAPALPLKGILGFAPDALPQHRSRITGTVTHAVPGHFFYVQEGTRAVRVSTRQTDALAPGDHVEAVGFVELEHHYAEMREAIFRRVDRGTPPAPVEITRERVLGVRSGQTTNEVEDFDSRLVTLRGRLAGFERKAGEPFRLYLDCNGALVSATLPLVGDTTALAGLRPGSELRVTGICAITYSASRPVLDTPTPVSFQILLRGPDDVHITRLAPWWTPERLWIALGGTAAVLALSLVWVWLLRRRVAIRGAQLAGELRARRDAEVEFNTTLHERERLAADLHDTLEQSLTGVAFQLETLNRLPPERTGRHLELATQMLARSREDVRRSVWNLRAQALDGRLLREALRHVVEPITEGTGIRVEFGGTGEEEALPDLIAGNLLLLAKEAVANALKHAHPKHLKLTVDYEPATATLTVQDDGIGFTPATAAGPHDGHFGLQGMRERARRLGADLEIASAPGEGTRVVIRVPIPPRSAD